VSSEAKAYEAKRRNHELDRLAAVVIFVAAVSLFFGFMTTHYSYDAVAGGVLLHDWIVKGEADKLFHKYHILYLPLAAAVAAGLTAMGVESDPLTLMQTINVLFAAGALSLFFLLARRLGIGRPIALIVTALYASGFSFWYYATDAEPYVVSIFFVMLAMLSALNVPAHAAVLSRLVRPGIWLGLAIGFHVTCVLALPALLLAIWPGLCCSRPYRRVVVVAVAAAVVAVMPYAGVYAYFDGTDPITGLTKDLKKTVAPRYSKTQWWSLQPGNVVSQLGSLGTSMVPKQRWNLEEAWPRLSGVVRWGLLALAMSPFALLARGAAPVRRIWMLLAWFLATWLFFSMYNSGSIKFASYQWAPLLLLIGLGIDRMRSAPVAQRAAMGLAAALVIGVFANSFDLIRRQTDPASNPHLARATAIANHTEPDDVIVHLGEDDARYQKVYLPYFAVRRSMILPFCFNKDVRESQASLRLVGERVVEHMRQGRRVVLLRDVAEPTDTRRRFEALHGLPEDSLGELFGHFAPRRLANDPVLGDVWALDVPRQVAATRTTTP
jgi:hypothetical protein